VECRFEFLVHEFRLSHGYSYKPEPIKSMDIIETGMHIVGWAFGPFATDAQIAQILKINA